MDEKEGPHSLVAQGRKGLGSLVVEFSLLDSQRVQRTHMRRISFIMSLWVEIIFIPTAAFPCGRTA